ncbi:MAG: lamin tail domain-containing protein, partial [Clostridiales bacterium]|nr:lamin tail domain-containing protein [Clostridiales bacterium]
MINFKKAIYWGLIPVVVFWSMSLSVFVNFIPVALANGGVSAYYLDDNGRDVMISATSTPYAVAEFYLNDSMGGTLTSLAITLKDVASNTDFKPNIDLAPLSGGATSSGVSLWLDTGDGSFDASNDTLAGTLSPSWSFSDNSWRATFSNIAWSFDSSMRIFLAFSADEISTTTMKGFDFIIDTGAVHVDGGYIGTWPTVNEYFFPSVWIGEAGMGGFGSPLLISEIQTAGNSNSDEFVEIYNRSPDPMNLNSWSLKVASSSDIDLLNWSVAYQFSTNYVIEAGGFFLMGSENLSTSTDIFLPINTLDELGGYVGFFNPMGEIADWVGYGSLDDVSLAEGGQATYAPTASSSIERKAFPDSTYYKMVAGGIHEKKGNGEDSNNNAMDFVLRSISEPQNLTASVEMQEFEEGEVIINEIYYKADEDEKFIELYNNSEMSQDISNYTLKHKGYATYVFPGATSIAVDEYLVIKWNQGVADTKTSVGGVNYIETGDLNMSLDIYGGDLILKKPDLKIVDYVEYGGSGYANESSAIGEGEWMVGDYIPNCNWDQSLGRKSIDGEDGNDSNDWQTFNTPSPGFPNMGGDSTAPVTVSSVILSDNDSSSSSGLDGNDISVSWVPAQISDPSFDHYEIFILPENVQIDFNNNKPIDSIYGGQYQTGTTTIFTYTGGGYIARDSSGADLSSGNYVAYVLAFDFSDNKSGTAQSVPSVLTGETYDANSDIRNPFIMHMGVWNSYEGNDIQLVARFEDDRELDTTHPAQVIWEAGTLSIYPDLTNGGTTLTDCIYLDSGFYNCVIPWNGGWSTTTVIGYYLKALDAASPQNESFLSSNPNADMSGNESSVQTSPFYINIMSAPLEDGNGDADLSGYTYSWDGNILASTTVFLEGTAMGPITTNASGTFAFADDTLDYGMYQVVAFKGGYMDMMNNAYKDDSINFYLNEGDMNMSAGIGDRGANPFVMWTAPFDNMQGAPINLYCSGDCSSPSYDEMPIIIAF